jgi:CheY-like chemotaxis protein
MATILCLDENENILQLHRALLESNGYNVLVALDGPSDIKQFYLALWHKI